MGESQRVADQEPPALAGEGGVMDFREHLEELRGRLLKAFVGILVIFGVALAFSERLIRYLQQPLEAAIPNLGGKALHFTGPMDVFIANLKVSFLAAMVFGCPIWIYQMWRFVEPALFPREKKYVKPFIAFSVALFFAGIAFCYFIILPLTLEFLIGLGLEVGTPIITVKDYFSLLTILMLGFGIVFETPVVLVLMSVLGLVDSKSLTEFRRIMLIVILVVAALLTPPDPLSQLGLAIPMYLMYELSIVIIRFIEKDTPERESRSAEQDGG